MSKNEAQWEEYWRERADPMHGATDAGFIDLLSGEIKLLLPHISGKRVVELGCGNGMFFEPLGFDKTVYSGVDFSPAMIDNFRDRFPELDLHVGRGEEYKPTDKVDLVFSHGVVQNFSPITFRDHLVAAKSFLNSGGTILHTSMLWDSLRKEFELGKIWDRPSPSIKRLAGYVIRGLSASAKVGNPGYWYSPAMVRGAADYAGLHVEFFGSLAYPYRMHARFTPKA
jgi:SAM-dependent methyltransferase